MSDNSRSKEQQLQSMPTAEVDKELGGSRSTSTSEPDTATLPTLAGTSMNDHVLMRSASSVDLDDGEVMNTTPVPISRSSTALSQSSNENESERPRLRSASGAVVDESQLQSLPSSIQNVESSELNSEENSKMDGQNTRRLAIWKGHNVVVKPLELSMIKRIQEREKQLLRSSHPRILRYLGVCLDPPSLLTLHMSNGNVAAHLYGKLSQWNNELETSSGASKAPENATLESQNERGEAGASYLKGRGDREHTTDDMVTDADGFVVKINGQVTDMCITKWAMQIAAAVSRLHQEKIIHGNISCRNVLLDENYGVKITDFLVHDPQEDYSLASHLLHWEAPEALAGEISDYSSKTDSYSIGLTLYEMAVRGKPWGDRTNSEVRKVVSEDKRPPLKPVQSWITRFPGAEPWLKIIENCWSVEPESRMPVWKVHEILMRCHGECESLERRKRDKLKSQQQAAEAKKAAEAAEAEAIAAAAKAEALKAAAHAAAKAAKDDDASGESKHSSVEDAEDEGAEALGAQSANDKEMREEEEANGEGDNSDSAGDGSPQVVVNGSSGNSGD